MSLPLSDSDSDDELPAGWEERVTTDGRVFYANHIEKRTQWTHPRTKKKKRVSGELPYGWERKITEDGHMFFVDHIKKKTTFSDPRLAFAVEDKSVDEVEIRQRFDGGSSALQILAGRDLTGKYVIVTGANSGIGYETARSLAMHGAHVVLACRNMKKAQTAVCKILTDRPQAKVEAIPLDLSSFKAVQDFVRAYKSRQWPLHILILNAAVFGILYQKTIDGLDTIFQVNYLSHFYLTNLFERDLVKNGPSRVVVVASESHRFSDLNEDNLSPEKLSPSDSSQYRSILAYNLSKLCCILFSNAFNWKYSGFGVTCNAVHPGNLVNTGISRNWWLYRLLFTLVRPFTKSMQQAAATSVYCAVANDLEGVGGLYFNNCCVCDSSKEALSENLITKLWDMSEKMIGERLQNENRLSRGDVDTI